MRRAWVLAIVALAAMSAVALAANGETVDMTATEIVYTGPATGASVLSVSEDPSNDDEVTFSSATVIDTTTPECGGDVSDETIVCNDSLARALTVTTLAGGDQIDIAGSRPAKVRTGGGADTVTSGAGVDDVDGETGDDVLITGVGNDKVAGGDGADVLAGRDGVDTMSGGTGDDLLSGDAGDDVIEGGEGADRLNGGAGTDTLRGNAGSDVLNGGSGPDTLEGGEGFDEASYAERTAAQSVTVSLNDAADDGESGELDNVKSDVEDLRGGAGSDRLTGDADSNYLVGGAGNDVLDGGGGLDFYEAGAGDDVISSRDGIAERVDCGDGIDTATTDEFDIVSGCETNSTSRDLQPDVDRDGTNAPADCNDRDPAIRPGATDTPQNGVDEDCSGADAPFERVNSTVSSSFRVTRAGTRVLRLQVRAIPPGSTVEVRCSVRRCPFRLQSTAFARGAESRSFHGLFNGRTLPSRGRIEVRIVKDGAIGKAVRFTLRRRRTPTARTFCIPVGSAALKDSC